MFKFLKALFSQPVLKEERKSFFADATIEERHHFYEQILQGKKEIKGTINGVPKKLVVRSSITIQK